MTRARLPNRRLAETVEFECGGLRYTCTFGRFPDGSIAELFLSNHKSNSAADTAARDAAIVTSIALQFGANWKRSSAHYVATARPREWPACGGT
jgi:hypothetical protein